MFRALGKSTALGQCSTSMEGRTGAVDSETEQLISHTLYQDNVLDHIIQCDLNGSGSLSPSPRAKTPDRQRSNTLPGPSPETSSAGSPGYTDFRADSGLSLSSSGSALPPVALTPVSTARGPWSSAAPSVCSASQQQSETDEEERVGDWAMPQLLQLDPTEEARLAAAWQKLRPEDAERAARTVYVIGLPKSATEAQLLSLVQGGEEPLAVTKWCICGRTRPRYRTVFAFIEFETEADALMCIKNLDQKAVKTCVLQATLANAPIHDPSAGRSSAAEAC